MPRLDFLDFTAEVTSDNAIIHEFFGPRRLGPGNGTEPGGLPSTDAANPASPLAGKGSLQFHFLLASLRGHCYHTDDAGALIGTLRSTCYIQSQGSGVFDVGFYACMDRKTLINDLGTGYLFGLSNSGSGPHSYIASVTNGIIPTPTVLVSHFGSPNWNFETPFVLECSWKFAAGVTLLRLKQSGHTLSFTDNGGLSTAVMQGLWAVSGTRDNLTVFWDDTEFFPGVF